MRRTIAVLVGTALVLAGTGPAAAHNLQVTHPQTGQVVNQQWIGGHTVPADAAPMFGPFNLPPSHGTGLVTACAGTAASPAASITAPPFFTGCQHGRP